MIEVDPTIPKMSSSSAVAPTVRVLPDVLVLAFYVGTDDAGSSAVLRFEGVRDWHYGYPNDEGLDAHPLHGHGLMPYEFHVTPRATHGERTWVATFHDGTLTVSASTVAVLATNVRVDPPGAIDVVVGRGESRGLDAARISGISPLFIVRHVPTSLAFYRDRLGFEITFQGPHPDDIFFGIVRRDGAQILLKAVGVAPVPNYTRDVQRGIARWDAYVDVPDPDALAAEFASRDVEFSEPLKDTHDGLRGFEIEDTDGYILFFGRPRG